MSEKSEKKGGEGRMMNGRVAVKITTLDRIRDLANGMNVTHDEAINLALDNFIPQGEDPLLFGRKLRKSGKSKRGSRASISTQNDDGQE